MDTHTLWMPPAYIILLSGVFQFFPTELLTARLFSSFISLGSILLVYRICLQYQFSFKRTSLVLLLLASDFLFLKFSHTARMESLCLFFALGAFYFLVRGGVDRDDRRDISKEIIYKKNKNILFNNKQSQIYHEFHIFFFFHYLLFYHFLIFFF